MFLVSISHAQEKVYKRDLSREVNEMFVDSAMSVAGDTADVLRAEFTAELKDSIAFPVDTTALKLLNMAEGRVAYVKQLSSTNTNGGGWFVTRSVTFCQLILGDSTSNGVTIFDHLTAEKRWVREECTKGRKLNALWGGAMADGSENDRFGIQAVFDAATNGNTIYFPDGDYRSDSTLTIDTEVKIEFDLNSTLTLTDTLDSVTGFHLLRVDGVPIEIYGGEFIGTWDSTKDGTVSAMGSKFGGGKNNEHLIYLDFTADTLSHVILDNIKFRRSAGTTVRLRTNTASIVDDVHLRNLILLNNYGGVTIESYGDNCSNVSIANCYINNTYNHPTISNNGGNALSTINAVQNLFIDKNIVKNAGRYALEVYSSSFTKYASFENVIISDNLFDYSGGRTVGAYGHNIRFINNTVKDSTSFFEFYGGEYVIEGNNFYNTLIKSQYNANILSDDTYNRGFNITNNSFYFDDDRKSAAGQDKLMDLLSITNGKITDNRFYPTGTDDDKSTTIRIANSSFVDCINNTIIYKDKKIDGASFILSALYGCNIKENTVIIDSSCTIEADLASGLWFMGDMTKSTIKNNKLVSYKAHDNGAYGIVRRFTNGADTLKLATYNASAWVYMDIEGFRTTPSSGDSVHGQYYIVRDSVRATPSGVFATHGGTLTKWDTVGTDRWVFYTIDDIILDLAYENVQFIPPRYTYSEMDSTHGDTIVIVGAGFVDNIVKDNDWDVNSNLTSYTATSAQEIIVWFSTETNVFYNNLWDNNKSFPTPHLCAIFGKNKFLPYWYDGDYNSSLYHHIGQQVNYFEPTLGDSIIYVGKVCVDNGKPGTWKEVGYRFDP